MHLSESRIRGIIRESLFSILNEKRIGGHSHPSHDDEFYTNYSDIERELSGYDFSGDVVYCNCDNPSKSNFYKYFLDNYGRLGLRGLYATYLSDDPYVHYYNGESEKRWKTVSGRFQDNASVMNKCTVVVTNPPFSKSMAQELVNMALSMDKDVVIVGPLSMSRRKDMFELIKSGKLHMGNTPINVYTGPNGEKKRAPSAWWTTRPIDRKFYYSGKSFGDKEYMKYDDVDAIECPSYKDIPDDYYGVMGVPERILSKINKDQFDIVGSKRPTLNGKRLDYRILIKKKKN